MKIIRKHICLARSFWLPVGVLLAILAFGCGKSRVTSHLTTTSHDRSVSATIDGPAFIRGDNDRAVLTFGKKEIVVEKERILVDGAVKANLPADAKQVEITSTGGKITVTADGKEVWNSGG